MFSFVINYYLMRDAVIAPFIKGEDSLPSKIGSFMGFLGIMLSFSSMEYIAIESTITIFFWCGLFGLILDKFKNHTNYSR